VWFGRSSPITGGKYKTNLTTRCFKQQAKNLVALTRI
jgi:hypothetical protein